MTVNVLIYRSPLNNFFTVSHELRAVSISEFLLIAHGSWLTIFLRFFLYQSVVCFFIPTNFTDVHGFFCFRKSLMAHGSLLAAFLRFFLYQFVVCFFIPTNFTDVHGFFRFKKSLIAHGSWLTAFFRF